MIDYSATIQCDWCELRLRVDTDYDGEAKLPKTWRWCNVQGYDFCSPLLCSDECERSHTNAIVETRKAAEALYNKIREADCGARTQG